MYRKQFATLPVVGMNVLQTSSYANTFMTEPVVISMNQFKDNIYGVVPNFFQDSNLTVPPKVQSYTFGYQAGTVSLIKYFMAGEQLGNQPIFTDFQE